MKPLLPRGLSVAIVAGLSFLCSVPGFAEILTPEQIGKITSELDRIQGLVTSKRLEGRRGAVDAFRRAAGSDKEAYEFYLACAKEIDFDRQGKSSSDFRTWRERQEASIKTPSRIAAMRLQLEYLVLTLRRAEDEPELKLLPEVEAFLAKLVGGAQTIEADMNALQRDSVLNTPFAKVYELDQSVKMTDWAYSPGNIGQVYDKFVLPFLRKDFPEQVAAAWDRRLKLETQLVQTTRKDDAVALEKFSSETLPRLQWRRCEDMYKVGQQQEAAVQMLKIVTDHSSHPDASDWIDGFRKLLAPPAPPAK
jgi:hypothetical protein